MEWDNPSDEVGVYQRNAHIDADPNTAGEQLPEGLGLDEGECLIAGTVNAYGEPVGADLRNRFVDGVRTTEPLFDPVTGFTCGAVIDGVNDGVDGRLVCTNFHEVINAKGACLE